MNGYRMSPFAVARDLGISYETMRRAIARGVIETRPDPLNPSRRVIPLAERNRLASELAELGELGTPDTDGPEAA